MAAPETFKVKEVFGDGQVLFEDEANTLYKLKGPGADMAAPGVELKGWKNDDGTFGIAKPLQPRSGNGAKGMVTDEATRQSIEKQQAARFATDLYVAGRADYSKATFPQDFKMHADAIYAAIVGD